MIKELGELNEKFYQLYGRLHKNKSLLAIKPEQIQYMATALFNQYKAEYKLLACARKYGSSANCTTPSCGTMYLCRASAFSFSAIVL